jgi:MoxR-like ATPase
LQSKLRALQKPLLVKGEPGTGKTLLAEQVAESLGLKLITWHIKSTTKAQQGCMSMMLYLAYVIAS